jgi:hypothetical protein
LRTCRTLLLTVNLRLSEKASKSERACAMAQVVHSGGPRSVLSQCMWWFCCRRSALGQAFLRAYRFCCRRSALGQAFLRAYRFVVDKVHWGRLFSEHIGFVVDEVHWGRLFSEHIGFPVTSLQR